MALRLRRGTDAERLTVTPLEGELIYTTDTEKLYVGDGSTAGGNPVDTDSITDNLADLTDVDLTGLADGDTIAYNQGNGQFEPATLATELSDLTDVDTSGVALNNVLKWNGAAFVPATEGVVTPGSTYAINIDGDLTGSVFADDSSLIVDGLTGDIITRSITTTVLSIGDFSDANSVDVDINALNSVASLKFTRNADTDISGDAVQYGQIRFGRNDTGGEVNTVSIGGFQDGLVISHDIDGLHTTPSDNLYIVNGQFAFGTFTPATNSRVDVAGNLHVTGGYTQFGSLTTTERNALTAAAGMVIWNSTTTQFEGYDGSNWINLVDGTTSA